MNKVETKRQSATFGCLATCYGMIRSHFEDSYTFSQDKEINLLEQAFNYDRENYEIYLLKKLNENYSLDLFVDSEFLFEKYTKALKQHKNREKFKRELPSLEDYKNSAEQGLGLALLDKWWIDMTVHSAHWVLLTGFLDGKFSINDPWSGKELRVPEDKFKKSVEDLKKRLSYAPALITVKREE